MTSDAVPEKHAVARTAAASRPVRASTRVALVAQVRSEVLKVRTVRSPLAIAGAALVLECVFKVVSVALLDPATAWQADVVAALKPSISYPMLTAVLGVLVSSAEWRYRTTGPTHTVQPRRAVVLAAKVLVAGAAGLLTGLLATSVAGGAALLLAGGEDLPAPDGGQLVAITIGSVAAATVLAGAGAAAGALVRNQVGALGVTAAVLFVLPPLALLLDPAAYAWTPSGAVDAMAGQQAPAPDLLSPAAGAGLLVGYAAALLAAALSALRRRDLT